MPDLQALVFDVDGTLADTEELHRQAFNHAFDEFGLEWEWTPRLYEQWLSVSGGRERLQAYAESLGTSFHWPRNPSDFFRKLHQVKTAHYVRLLRETNLPLRPGVRRLLEEAREAKLLIGIATCTARSNVDLLLGRNLGPDWEHWFDVIATSDIVPEKKPAPTVYEHVLSELGLAPRYCVAFEDTVNGHRAASGAGIRTVITTNYFTRNDRFPGASLVVDHLGEPDQPFTPRAGEFWDATFVDLKLLRKIIRTERTRAARIKQAAA
ncbi:MAG: HAD-IA family hydrolase [Gammaproteobacteria bacterium]